MNDLDARGRRAAELLVQSCSDPDDIERVLAEVTRDAAHVDVHDVHETHRRPRSWPWAVALATAAAIFAITVAVVRGPHPDVTALVLPPPSPPETTVPTQSTQTPATTEATETTETPETAVPDATTSSNTPTTAAPAVSLAVSADAPPPVAEIIPFATVEMDVGFNGDAVAVFADKVVVVTAESAVTVVDRDGGRSAQSTLPLVDFDYAPFLVTGGPDDVLYGIVPAPVPGGSQSAGEIVAIALSGPSAGSAVATTLTDLNPFVERQVATLGHGSNGIIDRILSTELMSYVDTSGEYLSWSGAPAALSIDGAGVVRDQLGRTWQLDITRAAGYQSPYTADAPPVPTVNGAAIYWTTIGAPVDPSGDYPPPTIPVVATLYQDGTGRWDQLPEGWSVAASDLWGTVLTRRTGTALELAWYSPPVEAGDEVRLEWPDESARIVDGTTVARSIGFPQALRLDGSTDVFAISADGERRLVMVRGDKVIDLGIALGEGGVAASRQDRLYVWERTGATETVWQRYDPSGGDAWVPSGDPITMAAGNECNFLVGDECLSAAQAAPLADGDSVPWVRDDVAAPATLASDAVTALPRWRVDRSEVDDECTNIDCSFQYLPLPDGGVLTWANVAVGGGVFDTALLQVESGRQVAGAWLAPGLQRPLGVVDGRLLAASASISGAGGFDVVSFDLAQLVAGSGTPTAAIDLVVDPVPVLPGSFVVGAAWTSDDVGWVATDMVRSRTDDGGTSWRTSPLPPRAGERGGSTAFFLDDEHAWVVTSTAEDEITVTRTIDGGATTQATTIIAKPKDPPIVAFTDELHGFVSTLDSATETGNGVVYRTDDGGATFEVVSQDGPVPVAFVDDHIGWGVANGLFLTRDGGATWSRTDTPGSDILGPAPIGASFDVLLATPERTIVRVYMPTGMQALIWYVATDDLGASWRNIGPPDMREVSGTGPQSTMTAIADDHWFVVREQWDGSSTLFETRDGGTTYTRTRLPFEASSVISSRDGSIAWALDDRHSAGAHATRDGGTTWSRAFDVLPPITTADGCTWLPQSGGSEGGFGHMYTWIELHNISGGPCARPDLTVAITRPGPTGDTLVGAPGDITAPTVVAADATLLIEISTSADSSLCGGPSIGAITIQLGDDPPVVVQINRPIDAACGFGYRFLESSDT